VAETVPGVGRLVAGRYRLSAELGRGGMGVVWLADDSLIGRQIAIKELRAPAGLVPAGERKVFTQRVLAEARNAARVGHPGAVMLHDVIPATPGDDAMYLVMEFVQAPTLAGIIARSGPLDESRVSSIGLQLLDVLDAAHAIGVVHRDVKPANIMVEAGDRVKLTDFGIAHGLDDPRLTRSGVMGTQAYLAPELFEGAQITPAVDMWSLGATLYHAAEGTGAFDRQTTAATLRAILFDDLPAPRCRLPLAIAISALLTRDPARRAASQQARALLLQPALPAPAPAPAPEPAPAPAPAPAPEPGIPGAGPGVPGLPPRPEWEMRGTTYTPGYPATPAPPSLAVSRFSSVPHVALRVLFGLATGILIAFLALSVITAPGIFKFVIPVLIYGVAAFAKHVTGRWRILTISEAGITAASPRGIRTSLRWDQVTRLGPVKKGSSFYLGLWGFGPGQDPTVPARLCPLGTSHFPSAEIRAAIIRYWPAPNLDPGL